MSEPRGKTLVLCNDTTRLTRRIYRRAQECIQALEAVFGIACGGHGECVSPRGHELKGLVVINFFALEGWHISEALGLPCAVVSPTILPYTPPSSFARRFKRAYPGLHEYLSHQNDGAPASWREVEHWLWPVFTERWGRWRLERLKLDEVPFLPSSSTKKRGTKVLYGCSPSIIQVPGYWPETVQVCGFWFPSDDWEQHVQVPSRLLQDFFGTGRGVVAITLSTVFDMGLLGGADEAECIIDALTSALKASGLKGIFVVSNDSVLQSAWKRIHRPIERKRLRDDDSNGMLDIMRWIGGNETVQGYQGSIPFEQLFPMCVGALHHGGSGTTAAALRAGIPQIILPCTFDQFFWAERMSWLGVSPTPLKASDFASDRESLQMKLSTVFEFLGRENARESAQTLQTIVLREHKSAVETAVDTLKSVIAKRTACPQSSKIDGVQMLKLPNGWHVACHSKVEAFYLFNEMNAYFKHISPIPNGVIIDVGANIGMFLLAVNGLLQRNNADDSPSRVHKYIAVEPLESNAACFKKNIMIHRMHDGVELHLCGLTNEDNARTGSMDFTYYPNLPGNSTACPEEKERLQKNSMKPELFLGSEVVTCPVSTLTSLLETFHKDIDKIDLIKVDVEGAELEVLQGISDRWWQITERVVVEVHDVNNRVQTVETLLKTNNFKTIAEPHESGSHAWLVWGIQKLL